MRINEVNSNVLNDEKKNLVNIFCKNTGNRCENGFIGENLFDVKTNDGRVLEFKTHKDDGVIKVDSKFAILDDSILIRQVYSDNNKECFQLYSWDVFDNIYTYFLFDNREAMNHCYNKIKENLCNMNKEDISKKFREIGVSFDNIYQILIHQELEYSNNLDNQSSFVM